jgi:hypothetical protein
LTGIIWVADVFGVARGLQVFHALSGPIPFLGAMVGLVLAGKALGCDVRD